MKMMLIAGMLITLPAIVVIFWFFGEAAMIPALASLAITSLPFLVAALLLGRRKSAATDADAH
jgi:hypothetical protein